CRQWAPWASTMIRKARRVSGYPVVAQLAAFKLLPLEARELLLPLHTHPPVIDARGDGDAEAGGGEQQRQPGDGRQVGAKEAGHDTADARGNLPALGPQPARGQHERRQGHGELALAPQGVDVARPDAQWRLRPAA